MSCVRQPCASCPWRLDQHADAIPNFSLDLAEGLVRTTSDELGAPIFACHQSRNGEEIVCAGWLARYGADSIAIRLQLMDGRCHPSALSPGDDWPELHETFREVIEKLRTDEAEQALTDRWLDSMGEAPIESSQRDE
jgi:hypothetical protein